MKQGIALKPVRPNWSIGNSYRIRLMKLTKLMLKDVNDAISKQYLDSEEQITNILKDAKPYAKVNRIYAKIDALFAKWEKQFIRIASTITTTFIEHIQRDVKGKINSSLDEIKQFKVIKLSEYDKSILTAQQALINENVDLITNIPDKLKEQIQVHVTQAISRGRDHKYLAEQLRKTGIFTENRVKLITRDQINKATSVLNHASQASLGITKQEWVYTGISKEPRQSHVKAAGKIYEIDKGCLIDGDYIYPGELINCKCTSAPYIEFDID